MTNANRRATPKFALGDVRVMLEAGELVSQEDIDIALDRHVAGDWGDVSASNWEMNDRRLAEGTRILSSYSDRNGNNFEILTDLYEDWTCVQLPYDDDDF